jgi:addiction module HigA family antidote
VLEKSNVHPGVILETEWMSKANINKSELSRRLEVSETMGSYITKGTRDISIDLAHKLAKIFNNHYHYWIDLQIAYDEGNNA